MSGVEVRTLTVVFTDLVASTERFSSIGDEAADVARRRHFDDVRRAVAAAGGDVVKTLGDGTLSAFTSVSGALAFAGALQQGLRDSQRRSTSPWCVRVGMSAGDVSVVDGDLFGEAVTEASRLCGAAAADQVLVAASAAALARGRRGHVLVPRGELVLKGLPRPVDVLALDWAARAGHGLRVVLADDAVLVREGVARLLEDAGIQVLAQVGDGPSLLEAVTSHVPDLVITDIRMPPTNTLEGLDAAERIAVEHPGTRVLVLSGHLDWHCAERLLASSQGGVGYLLKERVGDIDDFLRTVREVAAGATVIDLALERERGRVAAPG